MLTTFVVLKKNILVSVYVSLSHHVPPSLTPTLSQQMHQPSPGGHSSCSSEPSPFGTNHDSGVDTAAHSGGSPGDLSTLDDLTFVESMGCEESSGGVAAVGLHLRKQLGTCHFLERLKKDKLRAVRDSCRWANNPTPPVHGATLPPVRTRGEAGVNSNTIFIFSSSSRRNSATFQNKSTNH